MTASRSVALILIILVLGLLALAALVTSAKAVTPPSGGPPPLPLREFAARRSELHTRTNARQAMRCRPGFGFAHTARWFAPRARRPIARLWWLRFRMSGRQVSRCVATLSPRAIILRVFPAATERAAVAVAWCESHLNPRAWNPSGASGLFQLMPVHFVGRFDPFDPWANSRYAYRLSHAGYDWGAWTCRP